MAFRRSLSWSFSQQICLYILQFISVVAIARLLDPAEVGVFVLAASVNMFVLVLCNMGISQYLIQEKNLNDENIKCIYGIAIIASAMIFIVLFFGRGVIAEFIGSEDVSVVLIFIAISILFTPLAEPANGLLLRDLRLDVVHHATVLSKFLAVAVSISLAYFGWSYLALAWGVIVESIVRSLFLVAFERRHLRLGPSLRGGRSVFGFSGWVLGATFAAVGSGEFAKLLCGNVLGPTATALYDRGTRLPMFASRGFLMPISRVVLPSFAKDLREGREIGEKAVRLATYMSLIVFPFFTVLALMSDQVVLLLFGPKWTEVASILIWIIIAEGTIVLMPEPQNILLPYGKVRKLFVLRVVQLAASVALAIWSLPSGLVAFALSRIVLSLFTILITWWAIRSFMGIQLSHLVARHLHSVFVSIAVGAVVYVILLALGHQHIFLQLLTAGIASIATWLLYIALIRHPLGVELRAVVSGLLGVR